jgi:sugar phosphate isomerase/epimerase
VRYPLGVVDIVYGLGADPVHASQLARDDGFAHIDVLVDVDPDALALPVACPTAFPKPRPGWCASPVPPAGDGAWERAVRWWRAAPGALLEPWKDGCVGSNDAVRAFVAEVPGVRLLVDTGHVADWGGDPCELLDLADHVQFRQARRGSTQVHVDDPRGEVDFGAVVRRLDAIDYRGKCSIEYFDLPDMGWPLEDPRAWATDLATKLRAR